MSDNPQTRRSSPTLVGYLAKRFIISIFAAGIVIIGFIYLMDVIELLRRLSKVPNVSEYLALQMSLYKLPHLALEIAPFAILIGTIMCFTLLSRSHELVALRSAGLPARRFLIPPLLVCAILGGLCVVFVNPLAATLLKKYERLEQELFPGTAHGLVTEGGSIWLKQPEKAYDLFIYARKVSANGRELDNATIFVFNKEGTFTERLDAETMKLMNGEWRLNRVFRFGVGEEITWDENWNFATTLTPEVIQSSFNSPQSLSVWELKQFIDLLKQAGFPSSAHEMHFQRTLALPAFMLAMFLLAAPFALRFSRLHGMGQVLLVGLGIGFAFHFFGNFTAAYGLGGRLDILLAAWAPTAIAACIGMALFLQFREE